jgi:hypothetical protein
MMMPNVQMVAGGTAGGFKMAMPGNMGFAMGRGMQMGGMGFAMP